MSCAQTLKRIRRATADARNTGEPPVPLSAATSPASEPLLQAIRTVVAAAVQIVRNAHAKAKIFKVRSGDCLLDAEAHRWCLMIESIAEETERRLDRFIAPAANGASVPVPDFMNLFALSGFFHDASSAHGALQRLYRAAEHAAQRHPALSAANSAALADLATAAAATSVSAAAAGGFGVRQTSAALGSDTNDIRQTKAAPSPAVTPLCATTSPRSIEDSGVPSASVAPQSGRGLPHSKAASPLQETEHPSAANS